MSSRIEQIIDEIEEYIDRDCKYQPLSTTKIVVNKEHLEELLRAENYRRIQLMAEDTNPRAVHFYRKQAYGLQRISFFCKYI